MFPRDEKKMGIRLVFAATAYDEYLRELEKTSVYKVLYNP